MTTYHHRTTALSRNQKYVLTEAGLKLIKDCAAK